MPSSEGTPLGAPQKVAGDNQRDFAAKSKEPVQEMQRSTLLDPALRLHPGFERSSARRVQRCVGGFSVLLLGLVLGSAMAFECEGMGKRRNTRIHGL